MAGLFNTPEGCEFLGINTDKEYGLVKAKKGTPQYEQWLEKYRAKRGAKPKEEQKADAELVLSKKSSLKDMFGDRLNQSSDGSYNMSFSATYDGTGEYDKMAASAQRRLKAAGYTFEVQNNRGKEYVQLRNIRKNSDNEGGEQKGNDSSLKSMFGDRLNQSSDGSYNLTFSATNDGTGEYDKMAVSARKKLKNAGYTFEVRHDVGKENYQLRNIRKKSDNEK